jgi:hypothetical protein
VSECLSIVRYISHLGANNLLSLAKRLQRDSGRESSRAKIISLGFSSLRRCLLVRLKRHKVSVR